MLGLEYGMLVLDQDSQDPLGGCLTLRLRSSKFPLDIASFY